MYTPGKWVAKPKPLEIFHVQLENLEDIKLLLGATSIDTAYNRNRTILIEWTMGNRETFAALVGQYIIRNDRGGFEVVDQEQLLEDYEPFVEETTTPEVNLTHPQLGRLVAFDTTDGVISEVLFELPDGNPAKFVVPQVEIVDKGEQSEIQIDQTVTNPSNTPSPASLQRALNQKEKNNT